MYVVEVIDLHKKYGNVEALRGITVSIMKGECVGLLGPNGAGKTTFVKSLLGMVKIDKGTIKIMGKDITKHLKDIKRLIGVVPQEDSLDRDLNVIENIITYGMLFKVSSSVLKERANMLLGEFGVMDKKNEIVEHLSGGMKRKIMLARALINNPELLILDEPTVGLDPEMRKNIWDKISYLKDQGKTILLTTHYLDEAQSLCDRILIIDSGKIVEEGTPESLISKHLPEYAVEIYPKIELPDELSKEKKIEFKNYIIVFSDNPMQIKNILKHHKVRKTKVRPTNLEDLFLFLTGKKLEENNLEVNDGVDSNIHKKLS